MVLLFLHIVRKVEKVGEKATNVSPENSKSPGTRKLILRNYLTAVYFIEVSSMKETMYERKKVSVCGHWGVIVVKARLVVRKLRDKVVLCLKSLV